MQGKDRNLLLFLTPLDFKLEGVGITHTAQNHRPYNMIHKWGCGTELEMWRGSNTAEGVSMDPWRAQSHRCPTWLHECHIHVVWAGLGWAPHPCSSVNQQPSGGITLAGFCRASFPICLNQKLHFVYVWTTNKKWSFNTSSWVKWSQSPRVHCLQHALPLKVECSFGRVAPYHKPSYCCLCLSASRLVMNQLFINACFHPFLIPHLCLAFKTDGVTSFATSVPIAHFLSCHWGALPGRAAHK